MLYTIGTRELFLLTTNFYDDYILASMTLLRIPWGWSSCLQVGVLTGMAQKTTTFSTVCNVLGVQFDLSSSSEKKLLIRNTDQRIHDL